MVDFKLVLDVIIWLFRKESAASVAVVLWCLLWCVCSVVFGQGYWIWIEDVFPINSGFLPCVFAGVTSIVHYGNVIFNGNLVAFFCGQAFRNKDSFCFKVLEHGGIVTRGEIYGAIANADGFHLCGLVVNNSCYGNRCNLTI